MTFTSSQVWVPFQKDTKHPNILKTDIFLAKFYVNLIFRALE